MVAKKRIGRPPKPRSEVRSALVMVRFTKRELREYRQLSREIGESVPDLLRRGGLERGRRMARQAKTK